MFAFTHMRARKDTYMHTHTHMRACLLKLSSNIKTSAHLNLSVSPTTSNQGVDKALKTPNGYARISNIFDCVCVCVCMLHSEWVIVLVRESERG